MKEKKIEKGFDPADRARVSVGKGKKGSSTWYNSPTAEGGEKEIMGILRSHHYSLRRRG